jgi:hypothetical protein
VTVTRHINDNTAPRRGRVEDMGVDSYSRIEQVSALNLSRGGGGEAAGRVRLLAARAPALTPGPAPSIP